MLSRSFRNGSMQTKHIVPNPYDVFLTCYKVNISTKIDSEQNPSSSIKDPVFYFPEDCGKNVCCITFPCVSCRCRHLWLLALTVRLFVVPLSLELKIKSLATHGRNPTPDTVALFTFSEHFLFTALVSSLHFSDFLFHLEHKSFLFRVRYFICIVSNKTLSCHSRTSSHSDELQVIIGIQNINILSSQSQFFLFCSFVERYSIRRQICSSLFPFYIFVFCSFVPLSSCSCICTMKFQAVVTMLFTLMYTEAKMFYLRRWVCSITCD